MLSHIQSALRASIAERAVRVGCFLITFHDRSANVFRNYAIPDDGAAPTAADLDAMIAAFAARDRRPRLEYLAPAPAVDAALAAHGFVEDARFTVMTVEPGALRTPEPVAGVELTVVSTPADALAALRVQHTSYHAAEPEQSDVDSMLGAVGRGEVVVLARCDGVPAGSGIATAAELGMTEIAGVGVLPEFRRRRIASLVGAELTAVALRAGLRPFLQCESVNEDRLYGKLGYHKAGELVAASLPA